jgi:hypothetical protein
MVVDWTNPTLLETMNGDTTFAISNAVTELPNAGEWVNIETTLGVPHPIHFHGRDFFLYRAGLRHLFIQC